MSKVLTPRQKSKPFNFTEALNGREIMHWLGTPCFISKYGRKNPNLVEITTWDGQIVHRVNFGALEPMNPEDINFA